VDHDIEARSRDMVGHGHADVAQADEPDRFLRHRFSAFLVDHHIA
tara:strand:- start:1572 stop:1706 length:135 start_codon:yes stop_codon:yes gene_type:complete